MKTEYLSFYFAHRSAVYTDLGILTPLSRRRSLYLAVLFLLAVSLAGVRAAFQPGTAAGGPDMRWAGDAEGGAPYVEADPANPSRVVGFDVEIAGLIAKGLGRKPQFVEIAFASIDQ